MSEWNEHVKRSLKAEMVRRGVTNEELARRLSEIGSSETSSGVRNKINRGKFSAAFYNQCLYVMGCESFEVDAPYNVAADSPGVYQKINKTKSKK